MKLNTQNAEFILSAAKLADCPRDSLPQIAFAGRSNVGKSSVINRLLGRKNFARVGSAPGKTTHINYFRIDKQVYFVDLPGYGYAKVSKQERARGANSSSSGLPIPAAHPGHPLGGPAPQTHSRRLRHGPVVPGQRKTFVVVANKQDKIKKSEWEPTWPDPGDLSLDEATPSSPFCRKGLGKEELMAVILGHISAHAARPRKTNMRQLRTSEHRSMYS